MKILAKIPRNFSAKFCFFDIENNDYADEKVDEKVELTPEGQEKKEELNNQNSITRALTAIETGAQKLPEGFEKIPASEFLKRSAEELKQLFIIDGVVDFRGNKAAYQAIGFVDLFPKISDKQQFLVINGETYAYGARRKDKKIGYGNPNYKTMEDGVKVDFFVAEKSSQSFVKNDKEALQNPPEYKNFAGFSADYLASMGKNNLTPEQEVSEKESFQKNLESIEKRELIAKRQESQLEINENMNFKNKMTIISKNIGKIYDLPWEVIYAQAALESGRGKSGLSRQENNYFGIKGGNGKSWSTHEDYGNGLINVSAKFRGYSSMYDSAIGYAKFIYENSRYKKAINHYHKTKDSLQFLVDIKKAGYATDKNYVLNVSKVFKYDFGYEIPKNNSLETNIA